MEIVYASNRGLSRDRVLDYVRRLKKDHPTFKVVDIGGGLNTWSAEVSDTFVDFTAVPGVDLIRGDIHSDAVWREIKARGFDFFICSHMLEDIRDPIFVLERIRETFTHGYIAMPNKHIEFANIESPRYAGYCHHRWIFGLSNERLRMVAKLPIANYFAARYRLLAKLKTSALVKSVRKSKRMAPRVSDLGPLPWWDRELARRGHELAFIFKGRLEFEALNADFYGSGPVDIGKLYRDGLAAGL